jgi:hypothetical protein
VVNCRRASASDTLGARRPKDVDGRRLTALVRRRIEAQRRPDLVVEGKRESLRHDANHRVARRPQLHGGPNGVGAAAELPLPEIVAYDNDVGRTGTFVVVRQVSPRNRRHARETKSRRGDFSNWECFRQAVGSDEVASEYSKCGEIFHGGQCLTPDCQIVEMRATPVAHPAWLEVLDRHNAVSLVERERCAGNRARRGKGECADDHGNRYPERANERQSGILREHAETKREVQ